MRTFFLTMTILAAAAVLLAQERVITNGITTSPRSPDGNLVIAQGGAIGMSVIAGEPGNVRFMTQEFSFNGPPVTNQPYSAEEKTESVQTLADGNRIVNTTTAKVYRDSQGRTRREMTLPGFGGDQPHTITTISDPVNGTSFSLDSQARVAHDISGPPAMDKEMPARIKMQAEKIRAEMETRIGTGNTTFVRRAPAPNTRHEDLGGDVIEGVSVTGSRETSTIDAGAMGNERPITITSERWYSPELQIEVKSIHDDPRIGKTTHTITNVVRAEPDATLFQVPADYNKIGPGKPIQIQRYDVHAN